MKKNGFTLIELMVVVAIVGILLSMAVPTYQDYIVKVRVIEGLHFAEEAKLSVAEALMMNQSLPVNQEETNYTSPAATANVAFVRIEENGVIRVQYTKKAGNGSIIFVPTLLANGDLHWYCDGGSLNPNYRPAACRTNKLV